MAKDMLTHIGGWLHNYGFELNSREWASLIWLGILMAYVLSMETARKGIRAFLHTAFSKKLSAVWVTYAGWIACLIALADWLGIWKNVLTKDTTVWTVTAGLALIAKFTEASKPGFFKRSVLKTIGIVALLEYLVTLASFHFLLELILPPIATFFAIAPIVNKEPMLRVSWQNVNAWFLTILMFMMLGHTARTFYNSWSTIDLGFFALQAIWPVAMALWVLILVFCRAVVASYEQAFIRLDFFHNKDLNNWTQKVSLVLALGLNLRWIHEATKGGTYHVAHAHSVKKAFQAAKKFKAEQIAQKRKEDAYQDDLIRYAGSNELDEKGRPRDKREFNTDFRMT